MKFSPDLFKAVDHCQYRSFITNKYTGARIAVDCGQCDYCIHKKAQKASRRVRPAGLRCSCIFLRAIAHFDELFQHSRCLAAVDQLYSQCDALRHRLGLAADVMNAVFISLFPSIDVMIAPYCVIYFSSKYRVLFRMTVKLRSMFLLRTIGFLVWMLFVVLSVSRKPLIKRTIPLLNNTVVITLFPS